MDRRSFIAGLAGIVTAVVSGRLYAKTEVAVIHGDYTDRHYYLNGVEVFDLQSQHVVHRIYWERVMAGLQAETF